MTASHLIGLALLACALTTAQSIARAVQPSAPPSAPHAAATAGDAQRGERLFRAIGCYECHGTTGAGANIAPKIAPNPIPLPAFIYQLRHPIGTPSYGNMKMPAYGATVLSDSQVGDLYAYLLSIKPGKAATQIGLLNH